MAMYLRRFTAAGAILVAAAFGFSAPSYAQKTKAQLITEIATNFPDNTTGAITPSILRTVATDFVNSWDQYNGVNAQIGTTYTFVAGDYGQLVTFTNASPVAVTLPQATGSFSTFNVTACNKGSGTATITPTTSTIDGSATLVLVSMQCRKIVSDGVNYQLANGAAVTSVGLSLPAIFTVGTPLVTTTGTLTATLATQTANLVFASATSGGAAQPTFRALVTADLPAGVGTGSVTSVGLALPGIFNVTTSTVTTSGTLTASLNTQAANTVWAGQATPGTATPTFRALVNADLPFTFPVSLANGGTGDALVASNGGIFYSTATKGAILSGTATANQILLSGSSTTPAWSTATYPGTAGTAGNTLRSNGTNFLATTLAAADLSNGVTGSGAVVLQAAPAVTGLADIQGAYKLSTESAPSQITTDQNDYNPGSVNCATSTTLIITSNAAKNITGLAGGVAGCEMRVINSGSFTITLKDENVSSTAANRFGFGADIPLASKQAALLNYDAVNSRWRALFIASTATGTGSVNSVTCNGVSITTSGTCPEPFSFENCSLAASVGTSILTVNLKDASGADPTSASPCRVGFRSTTAATGTATFDSVTAALSVTTNAIGATLGSSSNAAFRFWVVAFDNGGTVAMSLFNANTNTQCFPINEGVVQSSTAMSASATSAGVYYTPNGTTLSSKAIKILGYVEYNSTGLTVAGTYATGPNFIQTFGPGISKPCASVNADLPLQINPVTGNINMEQMTPGGRLTLTSGVPVTTADVSGATTIYYAPLTNRYVPIYNGTQMQNYTFTASTTDTVGLSIVLGSSWTFSGTGINYDVFVGLNSTTVTLCTGPAWSSDTARGTGAGTTELQIYNAYYTNKNSMTCRYANASTFTCGVNQCTYLGTFRTTAAGQTDDTLAKRFVYNLYNQSPRAMNVQDSTGSWSYSTLAFRQVRAQSSNQLALVRGCPSAGSACGPPVKASVSAVVQSAIAPVSAFIGIGIDSSTVSSVTDGGLIAPQVINTNAWARAGYVGDPGLGYHELRWLESGNNGGGATQTWFGTSPGLWASGITGETFQ